MSTSNERGAAPAGVPMLALAPVPAGCDSPETAAELKTITTTRRPRDMAKTFSLTGDAPPTGLRMPLGRRGLPAAALAVIGAGLALNWGWLTTIGAAPLILSLAPCAAMGAAGMCTMGGSTSCATKSALAATSEPPRG